uniref:Uncharacterized protein n=1 Tax=Oryza brachyantha TaxID=4533 RepID=J3LUZ8_ORYBR
MAGSDAPRCSSVDLRLQGGGDRWTPPGQIWTARGLGHPWRPHTASLAPTSSQRRGRAPD